MCYILLLNSIYLNKLKLPRLNESNNMLPSWQQCLAAELTFGFQELSEPGASDTLPTRKYVVVQMLFEKPITDYKNITV